MSLYQGDDVIPAINDSSSVVVSEVPNNPSMFSHSQQRNTSMICRRRSAVWTMTSAFLLSPYFLLLSHHITNGHAQFLISDLTHSLSHHHHHHHHHHHSSRTVAGSLSCSKKRRRSVVSNCRGVVNDVYTRKNADLVLFVGSSIRHCTRSLRDR